jgi:hypothetical protein
VREPSEVWWEASQPAAQALHTSPLRHLPLATTEVVLPRELRNLCGMQSMLEASQAQLVRLLGQLRERLESAGDLASSGTERQTFIGLNRIVYETLADRSPTSSDLLAQVGILCEVGDQLRYQSPSQCRHDDGKYATFKRHFATRVAFAVIGRDRKQVATRLGVPTFEVALKRRGNEDGVDVTEQLHATLSDRIPELLAIMVHHSLGGPTLEPTSQAFNDRARRLQALRVRQLGNLALDAAVVGTTLRETIGQDTREEVYLENPLSSAPVLYHDLSGADWRGRIRRLLAAPLAQLGELPAYADTFTLLLIADAEAEREDLLQAWGITAAEVDAIRNRIGAVSDVERGQYRRWFAAIVTTLTGNPAEPDSIDLAHAALVSRLVNAGLPDGTAKVVAEAGGSGAVRDQTSPGSVLWLLVASGLSLRTLHESLLDLGEPGLRIRVSNDRFRQWLTAHGQRLTVVLAGRMAESAAKSRVSACSAPESLAFELDPSPASLLSAVVALLASVGHVVAASELATDPVGTLARLADVTVAELDMCAGELYDEAERARRLHDLARAWRAEAVLIAVLDRTAPGETRSSIRSHAELVEASSPRLIGPQLCGNRCLPCSPATSRCATSFCDCWMTNCRGPPPTATSSSRSAGTRGCQSNWRRPS